MLLTGSKFYSIIKTIVRSFIFNDKPMRDILSKGERTRQIIIEAAYALFIEQGFHATSMRQIAQRSGIALGGIYNHFKSKEQIFDNLLLEKHPYRQVIEILRSAPGDTVEEFIRNAARTVVTELGKRPEFIKIAFIELSEFKGKHAPLLYQTIIPQVLPLLERFRDASEQLRSLPPRTILLSFLGMFFSYYLTEAATNPNGLSSLDLDSMEEYLDIFFHGILKPEQV
jgi:AcrR family transcriptional regulator